MKQKLLDEVIPHADGEQAPPQFLEPTSEWQMIDCSPPQNQHWLEEWGQNGDSMLCIGWGEQRTLM